MSRHNLTDSEWNTIRVFLPLERPKKAGRPWNSHRQIINGILWVLRTGSSWTDLPEEFGNPKTTYNRFWRWSKEGLWRQIFDTLVRHRDKKRRVNRSLWCVDSSVIRAHRVAAGARKGTLSSEENARKNALGRSRGGYSTKIHIVTDQKGLPLAISVTPGQAGETPEFVSLLNSIPFSLFRTSKRPKAIAGDKAYSAKATREFLRTKGITDAIPKRENETPRTRFPKALYRKRNIVERVIGWLKEYRRLATRYEKTIESYMAMLHIAAIRIILNRY